MRLEMLWEIAVGLEALVAKGLTQYWLSTCGSCHESWDALRDCCGSWSACCKRSHSILVKKVPTFSSCHESWDALRDCCGSWSACCKRSHSILVRYGTCGSCHESWDALRDCCGSWSAGCKRSHSILVKYLWFLSWVLRRSERLLWVLKRLQKVSLNTS